MDEERLNDWEVLFKRALQIIDSVRTANVTLNDWTFGGGTVLMRKYRHRFSKDIDIFVMDPQYLGHLTPRLNSEVETLTGNYVEDGRSLKLIFPEGEIDFVAAGPLTRNPTVTEKLLGRSVAVETSTEIVAKKVWHRGDQFMARDLFDLAMVIEKEPGALVEIEPILKSRRDVITQRLQSNEAAMREAFAELEVLEFRRSYDECFRSVLATLEKL
jgi:predicted nucleotidyltransferase component of viral defense system